MPKRPVITIDDVNGIQCCPKCGNYNLLIQKQIADVGHTRDVFHKHIEWRVKCQTKNCRHLLGFVLKPIEPNQPIGPSDLN
tara:strand:- start:1556 stop:1798 length:243 start_codon:yes stop_codon:yes gene_type:complete